MDNQKESQIPSSDLDVKNENKKKSSNDYSHIIKEGRLNLTIYYSLIIFLFSCLVGSNYTPFYDALNSNFLYLALTIPFGIVGGFLMGLYFAPRLSNPHFNEFLILVSLILHVVEMETALGPIQLYVFPFFQISLLFFLFGKLHTEFTPQHPGKKGHLAQNNDLFIMLQIGFMLWLGGINPAIYDYAKNDVVIILLVLIVSREKLFQHKINEPLFQEYFKKNRLFHLILKTLILAIVYLIIFALFNPEYRFPIFRFLVDNDAAVLVFYPQELGFYLIIGFALGSVLSSASFHRFFVGALKTRGNRLVVVIISILLALTIISWFLNWVSIVVWLCALVSIFLNKIFSLIEIPKIQNPIQH